MHSTVLIYAVAIGNHDLRKECQVRVTHDRIHAEAARWQPY